MKEVIKTINFWNYLYINSLHFATLTFNVWFLMPRENEWIQYHQSLRRYKEQVEIIGLEELSTKLIINQKVAVIEI